MNKLDDFVRKEPKDLETRTVQEIETHENKISKVRTEVNTYRQE